jgi:outer membrane protein
MALASEESVPAPVSAPEQCTGRQLARVPGSRGGRGSPLGWLQTLPRALPLPSLALALALAALGLASACSAWAPPARMAPETSPSPEAQWTPPPGATPPPGPARQAPRIPPELLAQAQSLSLGQVLEVALRNNPATRESWWQARSAAANLSVQLAAWFPELDAQLGFARTQTLASGGRLEFQQTTYGPSLVLNYLLLDFGGRRADVETARQALIAADFSHNSVFDDVVLGVERAYYQYLNAKALLEAEQVSLREAETNLDSAVQRRQAGVATIADELQARTALAQAQLNVQTLEGQIQTLRGALATSMGLPATLPFDVGSLPQEVPAQQATRAVEPLIERALAGRPDLDAARARALAAAAGAARARSDLFPRLNLQGSASRQDYVQSNPGVFHNGYSANLLLTYPLFDGGSRRSRLEQARADEQVARARIAELEQQVVLQVFTDFYSLRTAAQRIETSRSLVASARQNEDAAVARYRAGVGSILDLLTAQSALASARGQEVQARADWFQSLAQLAHDAGGLPGAPPGSVVPGATPATDATPATAAPVLARDANDSRKGRQ